VLVEQWPERLPEHEQLLVLGGAEPVQDHCRAGLSGSRRRPFRQQRLQQHTGQLARRDPFHRKDSRLAVNAEAEVHVAGFNLEQGLCLAREGAAVERDAEAHGRRVGLAGNRLDLVQRVPAIGGSAGDLEDHEIADHTPPFRALLLRRGCHIVGDQHGAAVDAFGAEALLGGAEVHHVAGVVAETEQHARATVECLPGAVGLLGCR
jgi:hypothetical protein